MRMETAGDSTADTAGRGGFAVNVRHLPRLKELVDLALAKAIEVGLVPSGDGGKR